METTKGALWSQGLTAGLARLVSRRARTLGGPRVNYDGDVYYFEKYSIYLLVYVDDLMTLGQIPRR